MTTGTTNEAGWVLCGDPLRGKYHWFNEGEARSLCLRWAAFDFQPREQGKDDSPDNCAECKRRLAKLRAVR